MHSKNIIIGLFLLQIATAVSFGQTTTLPPAAQEAINNGIIATKVPDYLLAVRYFEEARKVAPQSPEIFFNLGLAESKIPGRELRAICWFGAYLTAAPDAPNTAAVKEQMKILFIKNQSNLSGLIKSVQEAGGLTSNPNISKTSDPFRMESAAALWAKAGDITAAIKTAQLIEEDDYHSYKASALDDIAEIQAESGDIEGAKKTAELIRARGIKSVALTFIAKAQIKAADITGANKTLIASLKEADLIDTINGHPGKSECLNIIAKAQLKTFDTTGARNTLLLAQKWADRYQYTGKNIYQRNYAETQILAGDITQAREVMLVAQKFVELNITDVYEKCHDLIEIAIVQSKAADISNAKKTLASAAKAAKLLRETSSINYVQERIDIANWDIATEQLKTGDISGAKKTANEMHVEYWKNATLTNIESAQSNPIVTTTAKTSSNSGSERIINKTLQEKISVWTNEYLDGSLNTDPFLDITGYLKSIPASDPNKYFDDLKNIADKIVIAQIAIGKMMKEIK